MTRFSYLAVLLCCLGSMAIIDRKYRLAFFHDVRRTMMTLALSVSLFIIWDVAGIALNIFYSPGTRFATGWYFAPDFPIEELFFLLFLSYFTLVTYLLVRRLWQHI